MAHVPVLYNEVLAGLRPHAGGFYIDGTVGGGGHAAGILERSGPDGRLLGFDRDPAALQMARARLEPFGERMKLVQASYVQMAKHAQPASADGILLDFGLSSLQMDDPARGFAFMHDGPLDMRFDPAAELTAAEILNEWPEHELADIIFRYGEERLSRRIARAIVNARPLATTQQLAEIVARAVGGERPKRRSAKRFAIHPATRTFQALRIAVNGELEAVEAVLPVALSVLKPGGRLAVITFHSLEDRIVKQFIRGRARNTDDTAGSGAKFVPALLEVTRKPIEPSAEEVAVNSRARSAKLRVAEKLPVVKQL